MKESSNNILVIDIGGSHVKATILTNKGKVVQDYQKVETPAKANPKSLMTAIKTLVKKFPAFDKIAVGFPGFIKQGVVFTAPNLDSKAFKKFNLSKAIAKELKKPVRLVNDADLQGFALIKGKGLEMVITLGTGFGTALFMDGNLLPHLELAHLPVVKGQDYDDFIGDAALKKDGEKKWNKKLQEVLNTFDTVVNYDHLYLSGGNTRYINFKLGTNVSVENNREGIKGGVKLWKIKESYSVKTVNP
ncbi:ROK family protein [Pedobacter arcticus]|uniref:ROK family protein n=1 Tax=Pedobacter arcticus TaxID=752140 RepID=UPI00031A2F8E|nr:ROK family protein [Pedobacter arcticus]